MKHLSIFLAALAVLIGLSVFDGTQAQKMTTGDGNSSTSSPVPVSVTNMPLTQQVTGTVGIGHTVNVTGSVAVTNLPTVQEVAGTVRVENFPPPAPITVNVITPTIHFAGFTMATLAPTGDGNDPGYGYAPQVLDLNRACHAEYPGSRACILEEIGLLTPPPPTWPDRAWDLEHGVGPTNPNVILLWAGCRYANGSYTTRCGGGPSPVACCGY